MPRPILSVFVAALASCGGGSTVIAPPPPPPPATFRIALSADPEDVASAQALGWTGIPDADVTLTPVTGNGAAPTARSSATGTADFGTVPSGEYFADVARWLTPTESAKLPAALGVDGWAIRRKVSVSANGGLESLSVPTSRRRSLVITEWAFNAGWDPIAQDSYNYGGYLKLYNNSDTTVYLDGMTIGEGFSLTYNYPNFPCSLYPSIALDPAGIWSAFFESFPGSGNDYPLLPGRAVVIATDAIDHRPFFPNSLDLSHADFEFVGNADVDNPDVPNMRDTGTKSPAAHGIIFENISAIPFVALPVSVAALPHMAQPGGTTQLARFPANQLLDVVAIAPNYAASTYPECPQQIAPNLDRAPSRVRHDDNSATGEEYQYSIHRRLAPVLSGGRRVLQHTRSGYADFVRALRSPSSVP